MARDDDRALRAEHRANWPVRQIPLSEEGKDPGDVTTADERLAMMETLALDAWASAGRPIPAYSRSEIPGHLERGSDGSTFAK